MMQLSPCNRYMFIIRKKVKINKWIIFPNFIFYNTKQ